MPPGLKEGKTYTFSDYSDYFDLNYSTRDILEALGYQYRFEELTLPRSDRTFTHLNQLRDTYTRKLPLISLTKDINALTLLSDLQTLLATLIGILEGEG